MKVLVIGGGTSKEREISLMSAKAVQVAALKSGHVTELYDWNGKASWLHRHTKDYEAILPMVHGTGGEDGKLQHILDRLKVPYLGSDAKVSAICFNKQTTLDKLTKLGVQIPKGEPVNFRRYTHHKLFRAPHVVKPINEGSSVDTYIFPEAPDKTELKPVFKKYGTMLLEEYVKGTEITVSVLDGSALPVIEIIPPRGGFFDYHNKYNGKTGELLPPKHVSLKLQKEAQRLAVKIFKALGCRHVARIDMIVRDDLLYVLEVNTVPGMTKESLYPKSAAAAGIDFPSLVDRFITLTKEKA